MYNLVAITVVRTTLVSPISLMTLETGLMYELQCQTNADPNLLTFAIDSIAYNPTQQSVQNLIYISELHVTIIEFTGTDIIVHCNWNVSGVYFTGSDVIEGKVMLMYLSIYSFMYNSSIITSNCITSQHYYY